MKRAFSTYSQALAYIESFINLERGQNPYTKRSYRLDRMARLLALFGHPERALGCLHIAGSKGKGSTAVMLASVLEAAGHRVGLYTSPHLIDLRERIRINRLPVRVPLFIRHLNRIKEVIQPLPEASFPGGIRPTFFEVMTLLALVIFREKRCRYAVLETGLGGRLDATNLVSPLASLLTPIELEHEDILGDTLEKIAEEKCGIIKTRTPVFSSRQEPEVRQVIRRHAAEKKAPLSFVDEEVVLTLAAPRPDRTQATVTLTPERPRAFSLAMGGDYQAENAALVWLTVKRLFPSITVRALRRGLRRACLPGRMEVLSRRPLVMIDGAHTPGSAVRIARRVSEFMAAPRILLFASVLGKKYGAVAGILAPLFEWIIVSTPGTFKKSRPEDVFLAVQQVHPRVFFEPDPAAALRKALSLSAGVHPILATGSFYFIAEIKKCFTKRPASQA